MEGKYRTFVQLDPYERWILRLVQKGLTKPGKRPPPMAKVIAGIIREYWDDFELHADPKMMAQLKKEVPPPRGFPRLLDS